MFTYDVDIHFKDIGWDTYTVHSDCIDHARYKALRRVADESSTFYLYNGIDCIRVYKSGTDKLLREYLE